jgi:hypothetical protein
MTGKCQVFECKNSNDSNVDNSSHIDSDNEGDEGN